MIKAVKDKKQRQHKNQPPLEQPLKCKVYTSPAQAVRFTDVFVG